MNLVQVQVWTDNFRSRYTSEKERLDFLQYNERVKKTGKMSRFFVVCFNVDISFTEMFKFPKSRGHGDFTIRYMEAAFNPEAWSGEFFIEFNENVWEHKLIECFQNQGAGQVCTMTFPNNDGSDSASSALLRVRETAAKTGCQYTKGECSRVLREKTARRWAAIHPVLHASPDHTSELGEFDIVKKRRRMNEAAEGSNTGNSIDALAQFEDFEQAVIGALTKIHVDDQENIRNEMLEIEESDSPATGGVYIAQCESLEGIVKIGATRRADPTRRLWEISRYVPKPFQLVEWIPTVKPFSLEAQIHRKLASLRLKERGAGTEFFKLDKDEIQKVLESFIISK